MASSQLVASSWVSLELIEKVQYFGSCRPTSVRHASRIVVLTMRCPIHRRKPVELTGAEFDILLLLVRSAGKVLSRDEIAELALGRPMGVLDRSIDNHISNLRRKLGSHVSGVERIRNVRGTGYVHTGDCE